MASQADSLNFYTVLESFIPLMIFYPRNTPSSIVSNKNMFKYGGSM